MTYLLNLLYIAMLIGASPWLLWRSLRTGRYREGWRQKLWGDVTRRSTQMPAIWLHAVSVGEVRVAATLTASLHERWPDHQLIVSTTTSTGYQLARRSFPSDLVSYAPLDFSWAVRRALRRWRPAILILVELELWPNLITIVHQHGLPVAVVNGRLSDTSRQGYLRIRRLVAHWLSKVSLLAVQNPSYAERFRQLGAAEDRVVVTGSIKFDGVSSDRDNPTTARLRRQAGIAAGDFVWVAGSTQAPEERLALATYLRLAADYPGLRLLLVPRHPERFDEVAGLLAASGLPYTRWTEFVRGQLHRSESCQVERVLLVDQVGDLRYWWGVANVAFVGGSLSRRGGQNMIEPAAFGIPVCFGPHIQNFADVVELLLAADGARIVRDERELEQFVRQCLQSPTWALTLGQAAAEVVRSQQGACQQTICALEPLLVPIDAQTRPRLCPATAGSRVSSFHLA